MAPASSPRIGEGKGRRNRANLDGLDPVKRGEKKKKKR